MSKFEKDDITIEKLKDEINSFNKVYFEDINKILKFNMDFLKTNDLKDPTNVDYIKLKDFIESYINNLKSIDLKIYKGTLQKLHGDVNSLYQLYTKFKKYNQVSSVIFINHFLTYSPYYKELEEKIKKTKQEMSNEAKQLTENLKNKIKNFEKENKERFKEIFEKKFKEHIKNFEDIINIKIYYLNKVFWKKARASSYIRQFFRESDIKEELNIKTFIKYYLRNVNTKKLNEGGWNKYLKDCLEDLD